MIVEPTGAPDESERSSRTAAGEQDVVSPGHPRRAVASRRHLVFFLAIQLAMAVKGGWLLKHWDMGADSASQHRATQFYLMLVIAMEWILLGYVAIGLRKTETTFSEIVGGSWTSAGRIAKDFALGIGCWLLWSACAAAIFGALRLSHGVPRQLHAILPRNNVELGLWLVLSATAGFVEELIYRGYLQRQFLALVQMPSVAVVGQGVVFGLVHTYQGLTRAAAIAVVGSLLGVLASWRGSLRPGMIMHAWMDGFAGVVWYLRG